MDSVYAAFLLKSLVKLLVAFDSTVETSYIVFIIHEDNEARDYDGDDNSCEDDFKNHNDYQNSYHFPSITQQRKKHWMPEMQKTYHPTARQPKDPTPLPVLVGDDVKRTDDDDGGDDDNDGCCLSLEDLLGREGMAHTQPSLAGNEGGHEAWDVDEAEEEAAELVMFESHQGTIGCEFASDECVEILQSREQHLHLLLLGFLWGDRRGEGG